MVTSYALLRLERFIRGAQPGVSGFVMLEDSTLKIKLKIWCCKVCLDTSFSTLK